MTDLPDDRCNRCRFWREDMEPRDPADENWGFGLCKIDPPKLSETYIAAMIPALSYGQQRDPEIETVSLTTCSLWPATFATDGCGKFESIGGEGSLC